MKRFDAYRESLPNARIYREGWKVLMNNLNIEAPLIAAVNGHIRYRWLLRRDGRLV
jgi:hypothetical protein